MTVTASLLDVLKDHVAAVMDVAFSPTGEELVSASYDRTIRLWNRAAGHSRDIYHTKRMQRVFEQRRSLIQRVDDFLTQWDVWLCPAFPIPAFTPPWATRKKAAILLKWA